MKLTKLIATGVAAIAMLAFTVGCQPSVQVDTSTGTATSSNATGAGNNTTVGAETPGGETP